MSYYSKHAGPKLSAKLEELERMGPDERHSLAAEIDVVRLLATRSMKVYEVTAFGDNDKVTAEMKVAARDQLLEAMKDVSEVVSRAARVRKDLESVVAVEDLGFVVGQVTTIIEREIAAVSPELAERVIAAMDEIKMPSRGAANADEVRRMLAEMEESVADEPVDAAPVSSGAE